MCGIFGYVSNNVDKIDTNAFRLLGLLNESRGTDSCGFMKDSDIFHGTVGLQSKFRNFVKGVNLKPESTPLLIGHTRKSSVGTINAFNAHPFGFGENKIDRGYAFIGVHNGTLYNYEEIANEFEVELKEQSTPNTMRNKIDSEILLESIYKSKSFKPLNRYHGGAALAWTTPDDGKVYLFSGESKTYELSTTTTIERPLHVWIVDEITFAFSSEKEPLEIIGAESNDVFQIETNTVYVITDGDFTNAEKVKVSRTSKTNKKEVITNNYNRLSAQSSVGSEDSYESGFYGRHATQRLNQRNASQNTQTATQTSGEASNNGSSGVCNKLHEPKQPVKLEASQGRTVILETNRPLGLLKKSDYRDRIYESSLRYHRNGHVINDGVYTYIPGYGLYYLGNTTESAKKLLDNIKGYKFNITSGITVAPNIASDDMLVNKKVIGYSTRYTDVPKSENIVLYYVFKGYLLDSELDYKSVMINPEYYIDNKGILNYINLSHISKYPILSEAGETYNKYIKNGVIVEHSIVMGPCYEGSYTIQDGKMRKLIEANRFHLRGIDIKNYDTYREELKKFKEREEKRKVSAFTQEESFIQELSRFLRIEGVDKAVVCGLPQQQEDEIISQLAEDTVEHFVDYEAECYEMKQNVGVEHFLSSFLMSCRAYNVEAESVIFNLVNYLSKIRKENSNKSADAVGVMSTYNITGSINILMSLEDYKTNN